MNLHEWEERYRTPQQEEDRAVDPVPLVAEFAGTLESGEALELACGSGRNAVWLASRGWKVTAVDGASAALDLLRARPGAKEVRTIVADLTSGELLIQPDSWDLIVVTYYFQRDLFPAMRAGVRPGGMVITIAHTPRPGEELNYKLAAHGELRSCFRDWEILHDYEGPPRDTCHHKRPVAEVVARRVE